MAVMWSYLSHRLNISITLTSAGMHVYLEILLSASGVPAFELTIHQVPCVACGFGRRMCMRGQVRFVVMGSVFPTEVRLHRKYDLKGSTQGRTVGAKKLSNPDTCLKVCAPHSHPILVPANALPSAHTAHRLFCLLISRL